MDRDLYVLEHYDPDLFTVLFQLPPSEEQSTGSQQCHSQGLSIKPEA